MRHTMCFGPETMCAKIGLWSDLMGPWLGLKRHMRQDDSCQTSHMPGQWYQMPFGTSCRSQVLPRQVSCAKRCRKSDKPMFRPLCSVSGYSTWQRKEYLAKVVIYALPGS